MIIRPENKADSETIHALLETAFETPGEARLVRKLNNAGQSTLSLVADIDHQIVGHIYFTPVTIEGEGVRLDAVGLGPLAVLPEFQGRGIGSALVRRGLDDLHRAGHRLVVVMGEPSFYSRFGFVTSIGHGINSQFEVPDEYFMIAELEPGQLAAHGDKPATIVYLPEFSEV